MITPDSSIAGMSLGHPVFGMIVQPRDRKASRRDAVYIDDGMRFGHPLKE